MAQMRGVLELFHMHRHRPLEREVATAVNTDQRGTEGKVASNEVLCGGLGFENSLSGVQICNVKCSLGVVEFHASTGYTYARVSD
jgi:hypothetical protein